MSKAEDVQLQEIVVRLPKNLLSEVDGLMKHEDSDLSEIIYQATKSYVRDRKKKHISDSMQRGYMEMAKINLNIASESFLAEEEAENTFERLVSGV
ncbi:CopG family transcriptional regulator/antitoxin EndoAI [Natronobacillus azotifigens]|nr:antitoxin [Natronobacillus azotifigens]